MTRRGGVRRAIAVAVTAIAISVGVVAVPPAHAEAPSGPVVGDPQPPTRSTEATVVDIRLQSGLYGGTVPGATAQTPYPTTGLQNQRSVTTAQIVLDDPNTAGAQTLLTYCIDLATATTTGIHYALGEWNQANVPNLPYVQWILDNYFPQIPTAPALASDADKVRAVQGAIWYFTDQFVVNRSYPTERAHVRAIVEAAQAALAGGAPPAPAVPTLTVSPPTLTGSTPNALVGPFIVGGSVPAATIGLESGTQVYRNAAGTGLPLVDGDTVTPGDQLWARYDPDISLEGFTVEAVAQVPAGNVFLYDGGNSRVQTAQKLVLAATSPVPLRASAQVVPPPAATGTLQVELTIAGAAAGEQGEIDLTATCVSGGDQITVPIAVAAETPAGTSTVATVPGLPAGAVCTLTQPTDGSTPFVDVAVSIGPAVTISAAATSVIAVIDTYTYPTPSTGALAVNLTTGGAAAASRGPIRLTVTCTVTARTGVFDREIDVPAATVYTNQTVATVTGLPGGAACVVAQTDGGGNADAILTSTTIVPATSTVVAGTTTTVLVTDEYAAPVVPTGILRIDASITGAAAGMQSAVTLRVTCLLDVTTVQDVVVPAGAAGTLTAAILPGVPAESRCSAAQTVDGANARAVLLSSVIAPASVVIADAVTSVISAADVYDAPAPPPSPSPSPTGGALPATGAPSPEGALSLAGLALFVGMIAVGAEALRRRRGARR